MSQKEKLIERFSNKPKDFTYDELKRLLGYFGYIEDESGNGSRVTFYNSETQDLIKLHKPHPGNVIKEYLMKELFNKMKEEGIIWIATLIIKVI